jgi:integrase
VGGARAVLALLEAADRYHRPILATLAGAGLRVREAVALDWQDVNLATGTLTVGRAKTDAGSYREVDLPGGLVEELSEWKAGRPGVGKAPVFVSRTGERQTPENVDRRLKTVIKRANKRLAELGIEPISPRVTPHSLRRTYISLLLANGEDVPYVMRQVGHADPKMTLATYARAIKRRGKLSGPRLDA